MTGLQRDFYLIQKIDQEEDPKGLQALQKIDFSNRGSFFPHMEFISARDAAMALDLSKRKINELLETGKDKHMSQFSSALQQVVRQDMMVSNMPKIRIKAVKSAAN
jgi:hypothetical protein